MQRAKNVRAVAARIGNEKDMMTAAFFSDFNQWAPEKQETKRKGRWNNIYRADLLQRELPLSTKRNRA